MLTLIQLGKGHSKTKSVNSFHIGHSIREENCGMIIKLLPFIR